MYRVRLIYAAVFGGREQGQREERAEEGPRVHWAVRCGLPSPTLRKTPTSSETRCQLLTQQSYTPTPPQAGSGDRDPGICLLV